MRNSVFNLQPIADKAAIGLSLLCAVHCLAVPLLVVLVPSLATIGLADESFHTWMILAVIPTSAIALTLGCRKHRHLGVAYTGIAGLVLLCLTPILGHDTLGELGEKALTLAGATLIALSHIKNFQLCQEGESCECPD
ncbi:hypothetical protein A3709_17180 [Halioglobus sp. HI00S01]|uniref:MerC domain-containing protein n=1 Tax=Halioglobus sp. HI00S01 TaxID=1822214 RepID=UPI0007C3D615|nr:MerC domain-containing protein [Halioglobus sp. HI00S01]KZX58736.1 hypothetical protein A3709_17180 [Halioglobus sp. HI00S01]